LVPKGPKIAAVALVRDPIERCPCQSHPTARGTARAPAPRASDRGRRLDPHVKAKSTGFPVSVVRPTGDS